MHPWHAIPLGEDVADAFSAVIETPRDSRVQYTLDLSTGLLRVKRVLFSAMRYPANYGFAPRTLAEDGEPLDVLVLSQETVSPMSIMRTRPIGILRMMQGGIRDDKVLAVHLDDPVFARYRGWKDLPRHHALELERFFNDYRSLESIEASTSGFGSAEEAVARIHELAVRYDGRAGA
jgi:inorganic pyrophosphatase